jgi:alkane 1-monooxygenase
VLDLVLGKDGRSLDPATPEQDLYWYQAVTLAWPVVQSGLLIGFLVWIPSAGHLGLIEKLGLFFGMGVIAGTIGIVYAHELMHRPRRLERGLADLLLALVLYGHFRSAHLLVHHRHVATPGDPASARMGEGFWAFFLRVLPGSYGTAARAEAALLARRGLTAWHWRHPYWRYHLYQLLVLAAAFWLAGWLGVILVLVQAAVAIWQLELVNYIEHYGLTRRHLGDGRYEAAGWHHSWNGTHRASNWLLINLQRHADHHMHPGRAYPLLQAGASGGGATLPHGYPVMTSLALVPPLWRWRMDRRVRRWRDRFYPDITDWAPYDTGALPPPRTG